MLNEKVIVITGGCGLLGRKFVTTVIEHGGVPVIADIDRANGERFLAKLKESHPHCRVIFFPLDITSRDSVQELIKTVTDTYGTIHALVNNAYPRNKRYGRKFEEVEYCDFVENLGLHLGGYFLVSQQIAEYFKKKDGGNIIFISSIYGFLPPRFELYEGCSFTTPVEYVAIKAGVIQLAKYMAKYYKGNDIRVNLLSPGGIFDSQNPVFLQKYKSHCLNKGMLDPKDICGSLVFLLSDSSKFVQGQNLVVDDGFSL